MIRVLIYFIALALVAYGMLFLIEHPGHVTIDWFGQTVDTYAALLVVMIAVLAVVLWVALRFLLGLPSFMVLFARQRRREKGYTSLSRGLIAIGSGDARTAERAAAKARRQLKDDPLALMLSAQAAQLNDDGYGARTAYEALAQRDDTHVLGLRGLFAEASRRGDLEAARHFAAAAHHAAPLPWSAQAVLEHKALEADWEAALATVESGVAGNLIDRETGERQRAVLETAIAREKEATEPETALKCAFRAIKRAPDLSPPVVLAARLLTRRGDIRKASRLIEKAWPRCQHPDIAQAYLDVRPGDSTADRLSRAKTLMGIAAFDPVSRLTVARAALANRDFATARSALAPLVGEGARPTVRTCLILAELEETEHGDTGQWREWLARASRAPLDPAWVADGIVYECWAPISPTTGRLDAFRWQVPAERLAPALEALDAVPPAPIFVAAPPTTLVAPSPAEPSGAQTATPAPILFHRHVDESIEPPTDIMCEPPATGHAHASSNGALADSTTTGHGPNAASTTETEAAEISPPSSDPKSGASETSH